MSSPDVVLRGAATALLFFAAGCAQTHPSPPAEQEAPAEPLEADIEELPALALPNGSDANRVPLSLTASDGTGLRLVSMKARALVQEPLAFTELHLVFENPDDRVIEGQFTIDLPLDAAISRFAMKIGEDWQEGEVVERQAARIAYEDFLHRRTDPALLENQAGNRFSARVFPIPARARKELVIAYSQELVDARAPYRLALAGLPRFDLDAEIIGTGEVVRVKQRDYTAMKDLEVPLPRADDAIGLRNRDLALARVRATGATLPDPVEDLTILFDTSASRALGFGAQVNRLGELVAALRERGDLELRVVAFDQDVALLFEGDAADFGAEQLTAIYSRRALGASDLAGALRRLARAGDSSPRVLVLSDGVATVGEAEAAGILDAVASLRERGLERLDAVIDGGMQDRDTLAAMAMADLPRSGIVIDGRRSATEIADRLSVGVIREVAISVPGSEFSWPHTIRGVQPGDELLVYAQLPEDTPMTVVIEGETRVDDEVHLVACERPLLERALAGARIDALTQERALLGGDDVAARERLAKKIVDLSTTHRVLSDFTALLVLETEADYRRFGIDRNALGEIMTVGEGGIELVGREPPRGSWTGLRQIQAQQSGNASSGGAFAVGDDDEDVWGGLTGTEIGEAFGVAGLGLAPVARGGSRSSENEIGRGADGRIGAGGGGGKGAGYGRGAGAGFGGRGRRVPAVRQAQATIHGAVDKDIVRRIVRAHINEVRHCYNQGLVRDPNLGGRVAVQFTIGPTGRVPVAVVAESSVKDGRVAVCIARAVKRWRFPSPRDAGNVVVTYPFLLEPTGGRAPARAYPFVPPLAPEPEAQAYSGQMRDVIDALDAGRHAEALALATEWRDEAPGDVVALLALGEVFEAEGHKRSAARAYGSLIDLFPSRADIRRYAGNRLERLGDRGRALAIDTYREAVAERPDHPHGHRLYAYALLRDNRPREAFTAIVAGAKRDYPEGRFNAVKRILREDVGLIAAAWIADEPGAETVIRALVRDAGAEVPMHPSFRVVMSWETDTNDVDLHAFDGDGGHAFHGHHEMPSGGTLYGDVTTGYGPECFAIESWADAFPYRFEAKYFRRGPMGFGMGTLQIIEHDGAGRLAFDDRPFLLMKDDARVELGTVFRSLFAPPP